MFSDRPDWQRCLAGYLLAALALALAMPGVGWWPLLVFVGPALGLAAEAEAGWRTTALAGLAGGVLHWAVSITWIGPVLADYGGLAAPLAGLGMLLAATMCGVFWVPLALVLRAVAPAWRPLALPAAWAVVEAWRQFPPLLFPWNPTAAGLVDQSWAMAGLDQWGATGLAWAVLAIGAGLWPWALPSARRLARVQAAVALLLMVVVALLASGVEHRPGPKVAVLQPATLLEERWDPASWTETVARVEALSARARAEGAELILWPEGAVPYRWDRDPAFRRGVENMAGSSTIVLNTALDGDGGVLNAAVSSAGEDHYAKIRLVPFGEYVPAWGSWILGDSLVREVASFVPGSEHRPLETPVAQLGVAICYEVVFAEHAAAASRDGAELLVSLTNDGWYGTSRAPAQHLAQARLRAAETDRALARAALTGISALIAPGGAELDRLALGERDLLVAALPLASGSTRRSRFGDWWALLSLVVVVATAAASRRSR